MKLTQADYKKILKYYKLTIPKNHKKTLKKAENIIAKKLCSCIKKVEPKFKKEAPAIGICTKSVIGRKGYKRGKFSCKTKKTVKLYKGGRKRKHKGGGTPKDDFINNKATFESTKMKLKEILEKVPPDNEFSPFSKKILDNFDSFKQESFNKFVDITYKNLDDIMRGSKQKGGNGDERYSPYDIQCSICQDDLVPEFNSDMQRIHACSYCNKTFHEQCLRDWRNECPLCRTVGAFPASIWPNNQPPQQQPDNFATIIQVQEMALRQLRRERRETRLRSYRTIILGLYFVLISLWMILLQYDPNSGGNWLVYAGLLTYFLGNFGLSDDIKIKIMRFCERCYRWWSVPDRVRALQDLGINNMGGGKKTRRKRRKRKKKTKRRRRKKRGGGKRVKIKAIDGMNIEVEYKMDDGTKQIYTGVIEDSDKKYVKVRWDKVIEGEENPSWIIWKDEYYTKDTIVAANALLELSNSHP